MVENFIFVGVTKQQVLQKDYTIEQSHNNNSEAKKTENKSRGGPRSSKNLHRKIDSIDDYDSNKNYTNKIISRVVNGTKVNKKLNIVESKNVSRKKQSTRVKNGLKINKKQDESIEIDENNSKPHTVDTIKAPVLAQNAAQIERPYSAFSDIIVENIAERIKTRKRVAANTDKLPCEVSQVLYFFL